LIGGQAIRTSHPPVHYIKIIRIVKAILNSEDPRDALSQFITHEKRLFHYIQYQSLALRQSQSRLTALFFSNSVEGKYYSQAYRTYTFTDIKTLYHKDSVLYIRLQSSHIRWIINICITQDEYMRQKNLSNTNNYPHLFVRHPPPRKKGTKN